MSSGIVWCRTMSSGNFTMQTAVPCGCSTMSYNIVRYGNSVVKSMYSITATPDDIVRYRAQCEHRLRVDCWCGRVDKSRELSSACHNARLPKRRETQAVFSRRLIWRRWWLTLNSDAHCCHTDPAIKHPLFVIFDIRALWRSALSVTQSARMSKITNNGCFIAVSVWRLNPVWHRMLYSCPYGTNSRRQRAKEANSTETALTNQRGSSVWCTQRRNRQMRCVLLCHCIASRERWTWRCSLAVLHTAYST